MKQSRKFLLITSEFPPQPGGIGNHAWHLAQAFQKKDIQVQVISDQRSGEGEEEKQFDQQQRFKTIRIKRRSLILISYLNRIIKAFQLAKEQDVVLLSGKFSIWVGGLLSLFIQKEYVAVLHGSEVLLPSSLQRKYTQFCLQRFDKIIAVSHYTKSLVAHLELNQLKVIPNGFNISSFDNTPKKAALVPLQLVTVGNVTPRKGQHNIIKALPHILEKYPQVTYHIVGIPTTQPQLMELAVSLGVEKHLVFYGRVTEDEKLEILKKSTLFMMLSEHTKEGDVEGFGIAILEANALGIPGIGAKGCGIEDAIDNYVSGVLVDGKNEQEVVGAIDEIIGDYPLYSQRALKWTQNFTWDKIIQQYLAFLS